jgi:hypothetical protein
MQVAVDEMRTSTLAVKNFSPFIPLRSYADFMYRNATAEIRSLPSGLVPLAIKTAMKPNNTNMAKAYRAPRDVCVSMDTKKVSNLIGSFFGVSGMTASAHSFECRSVTGDHRLVRQNCLTACKRPMHALWQVIQGAGLKSSRKCRFLASRPRSAFVAAQR